MAQATRKQSRAGPGLRAVVGSAVFFLGMGVSALIVVPLSLVLFPFSYRIRFGFVSQWARFNLWSVGVLCGLRFEVKGADHIPDEVGVAFCKHQSMWETLALQQVLPAQAWVLKQELLRVPVFGWGLKVLEPIAIDRSAGRKAVDQVVSEGKDRLAKGRWIVVFPEGTRIGVGETKKFGIGGAILAKKAGVEILPIAHNAGCFWPRHGFIKRAGVIQMVIGEPIGTAGKSLKEINAETKDWIDGETHRLEVESGCVPK
jgi:1-acyl-sn-glycerol-3-phosphate acyltransferase